MYKWNHDDVIKRKHFPRYWPFVRGIHRSPVNSPHKGQWRGALMFSLICVWINGWVNNGEAGDLIRHRVHYDVTVMKLLIAIILPSNECRSSWNHRRLEFNCLFMITSMKTSKPGITCPFPQQGESTGRKGPVLGSMMTPSNGNIFRVTGHCVGNSPVTGECSARRPVTRSFDVFFDLHPNKRLSKQSWGWWFETPSRLLLCHCKGAFLSWRHGPTLRTQMSLFPHALPPFHST